MFEVVFTDTQFLMRKPDLIAKIERLAFHENDLNQGSVQLYVRVPWLPYEVIVSLDRKGWQTEAVYNMQEHRWQNIDELMEDKEDDDQSTAKIKNQVMQWCALG